MPPISTDPSPTFAGAAPPWFRAASEPEHNLHAHLYAGVTSAVDVGGPLGDVLRHRDRAPLGPRLIVTGEPITARGGYPTGYVRETWPWPLSSLAIAIAVRQVGSAEAGRRAVRRLDRRGADLVKLMIASTPADAPVLQGEALAAIVAEADARGLPVVAHVDSADNAMRAARAGVDVLVHGVHTGVLTPEQAAELAELGTVVVPTLVTFERLQAAMEDRWQGTAIEEASEPAVMLDALRHPEDIDLSQPYVDWLETLQNHGEDRSENVAKLLAAGVPIGVGTDSSGSLGVFAGAIHEELRLLVEAGMSEADVLHAATVGNAAVFALDVGEVVPGAVADLLIVTGDPLQDIGATEQIAWVIRDGVVLAREEGP